MAKKSQEKLSTNIILKFESNIAIVIVRSALICWLTWTASINIAADDVIIPIGLLIMAILSLRCCSCCSVHAIDICSSNGKSVRSESSTQTHDKIFYITVIQFLLFIYQGRVLRVSQRLPRYSHSLHIQ
jgi:hypothetical protein